MEVELELESGEVFNFNIVRTIKDTGSRVDDKVIINNKEFRKGDIKSWKVYFGA